jgi:hypothetical protein
VTPHLVQLKASSLATGTPQDRQYGMYPFSSTSGTEPAVIAAPQWTHAVAPAATVDPQLPQNCFTKRSLGSTSAICLPT